MADLPNRIARLERDRPITSEPRLVILERLHNRLDAIRIRLGLPEPSEDEIRATHEAGRAHLANLRRRMRR